MMFLDIEASYSSQTSRRRGREHTSLVFSEGNDQCNQYVSCLRRDHNLSLRSFTMYIEYIFIRE